MSDPQKTPPRPELTRVPVKHLYFTETIDFPGMGADFSMKSNVACGKPQDNATRWVTADWIPAWLCFVLVFHTGNTTKERCIPMSMVKQWERSEPAR